MIYAIFDDNAPVGSISKAEFDVGMNYWACDVDLLCDCDGNEGRHRIYGISFDQAQALALEFVEKMVDRRPIIWI